MEQSAFDILCNKYDAPAVKVVEDTIPDDQGQLSKQVRQPLTDWKDSQPIKMLSVFLQEFNDQGIYLKQTREGIPVLCFVPGLKNKKHDQERWAFAIQACELRDAAMTDLKELIFNGSLKLQSYVGIWY